MFCVCLKLPYQHQIKKINHNIIPIFLETVEVLAKDNGCKKIIKKDLYFYVFEHSSSFFVLRFLYSLSLLLKQVSNNIHESSIIVEYYSNEEQIECLNKLQNMNLEFNCILVGSKASNYFKKYILLNDIKSQSLKRCTSFSFFEDMNCGISYNEPDNVSLFFRKEQNYIQVLYNFISCYPISDSDVEYLSKQDAKTYFETRCVLTFFSKNRFNNSLPKYFLDAFIIYVKLHIKIYKNKHNIKLITIYTDCKEDNTSIEKLKQILKETRILPIFKKQIDIEKIPDDLLEIIYMLIFSSKFIFDNELEDFFFVTTETNAFKDLMKIMYQRGIIIQNDCIFSYQTEAVEKIEKKLKGRKNNTFIAKYLWSKYKNEEIVCDLNLKKIFDSLKFQYDVAFNIDLFFNLKKHYFLLKSDEEDLKLENIDVLRKYDSTIEFKDRGEASIAFSLTKELLSYFHNARILSGEYRSYSLLGLLFLENNNIAEALTYFSYSLEIAKKTNNPQFMCEALCYLSIVYFLQKDFQNCVISLQEFSNTISFFFMQEWKVLCLFIQARLFIELGEVKKASAVFKLAKDFSSLYFTYIEETCDIWYGKALIAEGKIEKGRKILECYERLEAFLFLLESVLLFPQEDHDDIAKLKEKYDSLSGKKQLDIFLFFEDIAWHRIYKQSITTRLFEAFYNYYMIILNPKTTRSQWIENLKELEKISITSLYSKDNNASIYLYLSYIAQCKVDGEVTGKALGFLSKACNILQKNTSLMYDTSMREKFMKQNLWNAKLFEVAIENKLI